MIKKLQIKFISMCMVSIFLVLLSVFAVINVYMYVKSFEQTSDTLELKLHRYLSPDNMPPVNGKPFSEPYDSLKNVSIPFTKRINENSVRFFYAELTENGEVSVLDTDGMSDITEAEAKILIGDMFTGSEKKGLENGFQYIILSNNGGYSIIVGDRSVADSMLAELFWTSLAVLAAACIAFFVVVLLLSRQAISPVKDAYLKQQTFLADAGHELKTPITIIKADADVLNHEIGNNKWLESIKEQSDRLSELVHDMISLAKTKELPQSYFSDFDLSSVLMSTVLEFESMAFEKGKAIKSDIPAGVVMHGDEKSVRQLAHILIDNAIKHSMEEAVITVSLSVKGGKKHIKVSNTNSYLSERDRSRIFERFYRSDASRSRDTGGYGLGLSIAHAVVSAHNGKITASCTGSTVTFEAVL